MSPVVLRGREGDDVITSLQSHLIIQSATLLSGPRPARDVVGVSSVVYRVFHALDCEILME